MAKITMTGSAVLIAESLHGTFGRTTRMVARVDAATDEADVVYFGAKSTVTANTNAATDGVPFEAGEILVDDMQVGDKWYAIGPAGVEIFVEKNGSA